MERFTEWRDAHGAGKPGKDCYTQLAKYEDTGLTPEQIFEMISYLDVFRKKKDEALYELWKELEDVTIDPKTECITQDWCGFKAGTPREDIWHWFDERHSKGVVYLMYGRGADE